MKKYALLTAAILTLTISGAAWGQTAPSGNGAPPQGGGFGQPQGGGQGGGFGQPQGGEQREEHFQEHKAEILKRLEEHRAETEQRIRCVEAASNHEALRACMPERGGSPPGGNR